MDIYLDFPRGQFTNNVEQPARRKRSRTFLLHVRLETAAPTNVEIRRRQMHGAIARLKQHVRKNRQCRASTDDVLDLLQTFQQLFLVALNFMRTNLAKMLGGRSYWATAKSCALGSTKYTQRCSELSMNEIVCRILSCSFIRC